MIMYKLDANGYGRLASFEGLRFAESKDQMPLFQGTWPDEWVRWRETLFTDACVLCGTDYVSGVPGIGIKRAWALLRRYRSLEACLPHALPDSTRSLPAEARRNLLSDLLAHLNRAKAVYASQRVYDPTTGRVVRLDDPLVTSATASGLANAALSAPPPSPTGVVREEGSNDDQLGPPFSASLARAVCVEATMDPIALTPVEASVYAKCPPPVPLSRATVRESGSASDGGRPSDSPRPTSAHDRAPTRASEADASTERASAVDFILAPPYALPHGTGARPREGGIGVSTCDGARCVQQRHTVISGATSDAPALGTHSVSRFFESAYAPPTAQSSGSVHWPSSDGLDDAADPDRADNAAATMVEGTTCICSLSDTGDCASALGGSFDPHKGGDATSLVPAEASAAESTHASPPLHSVSALSAPAHARMSDTTREQHIGGTSPRAAPAMQGSDRYTRRASSSLDRVGEETPSRSAHPHRGGLMDREDERHRRVRWIELSGAADAIGTAGTADESAFVRQRVGLRVTRPPTISDAFLERYRVR